MSSHQARAVDGHRVSLQLLDETFAGPVTPPTMAELRAGQHSRRLLLLKVARDLAPVTEDAWDLLVEADRRAPDAVRQVLTYPAVGTWLVRMIRKARGIIADDVPIADEMAYLGSVAAAAATRAGMRASVEVPVSAGRVNLPTIGQFETGGAGLVRLGHTADGVCIDGRATAPAEPLRRHRSEADGVPVWWTIDDIDPYRAFGTVEPPTRLDDTEYTEWCQLLDEAWDILVRRHACYAAELAQVGPVVVPVSHSHGLVASTSSTSFGAIVVAMPSSAEVLAETLVHELQHSKLNAVLDLVRLEDGSNRLCYAPWRRDPRPLSGLLHGIYAFMSVVEFRRGQWHTDPGNLRAAYGFLFYREQVRAAVRAVEDLPELTAFGRRLVRAVEKRLAACEDPVPEELVEPVRLLLAEHRLSWRLRHLTPRAGDLDDVMRRWLAGGPPPGRLDSVVVPFCRPSADSILPRLLRVKAMAPDGIAQMASGSGEYALVCGRHTEAAEKFAARIMADAEEDAAWVGLLAAVHGDHSQVPAEVVADTYRRLSDAPDPVALATWFASG